MFALIGGNKIVYKGAYDGLMLWFNNVIPLLLPFMLISALIVEKIKKLPDEKQNKYAILITIFTGLFCGYPIGAKNTAEFVGCGSFDTKTGNLLLPLCNNCSPMFLSGYILLNVLNNKVSFFLAVLLIYAPYIFYLLLSILFDKLFEKSFKKTQKNNNRYKVDTSDKKPKSTEEKKDQIILTITQITYVGFYIIICSIISEYIMSTNLPDIIRSFIAGLSEITNGTMLISKSIVYNNRVKNALILSLSSFGGISAILQTKNVIKNSGLSILKYTITKTICALATYGLAYYLI